MRRNIAYVFTVCLVAVICLPVSGRIALAADAGEIGLTAKADRDTVNIGDRVKVEVTAESRADIEYSFPKAPPLAEDITFVESKPVKKGWGRSAREGMEYVMSVYTTGTQVFPPMEVQYREKGGNAWNTVETPQIPIMVETMLTGEYTDVRGIKGLTDFRSGLPIKAFIVILAVIAVAIIALLGIRRSTTDRTVQPVDTRSPYEIALDRLKDLRAKDMPGQGLVKEYYTELSDIIRHYLEDRFSYRSPEMTTEEFMAAIKASDNLTFEQKRLLRDFLCDCDMVKFAKYGPAQEEMLRSFESASRLVEQTKAVEKPEEEGDK